MAKGLVDNSTAEFLFRAPNETILSPSSGAPLSPSSGAPLRPSLGAPLRPSLGAPLNKAEFSFRAPIKHSNLRRKSNYNYCSRAIYLITVTTSDRQRLLGTLVGDSPDNAVVIPTPLGEDVISFFKYIEQISFQKTGCQVQVIQYQLMPDHFHGILFVKDELPHNLPIGKIIRDWKGACSRAYWASLSAPLNKAEKIPLFSPGFNDKILFHEGQLQNWIQYLHDNPRRLWLKIHYPDRLRKVYNFAAGEKGHLYTAVGNTFFVKYPDRVQVRCHRNLTETEINKEVSHYLNLARQGAILVSPFISPAEKAVYDACFKEHLRMIHIVNRGLDGQFIYPTGRDLRACINEFLLVLAPYANFSEETKDARITRNQCLNLNDFAQDLSTAG